MGEIRVNAGHTKAKTDTEIQSCKQAFMSDLSPGFKNPSRKKLIILRNGSEEGFVELG